MKRTEQVLSQKDSDRISMLIESFTAKQIAESLVLYYDLYKSKPVEQVVEPIKRISLSEDDYAKVLKLFKVKSKRK